MRAQSSVHNGVASLLEKRLREVLDFAFLPVVERSEQILHSRTTTERLGQSVLQVVLDGSAAASFERHESELVGAAIGADLHPEARHNRHPVQNELGGLPEEPVHPQSCARQIDRGPLQTEGGAQAQTNKAAAALPACLYD